MFDATLGLKDLGPKSPPESLENKSAPYWLPTKKMAQDRSSPASVHLLAFPGITFSSNPLPFLFLFEEIDIACV